MTGFVCLFSLQEHQKNNTLFALCRHFTLSEKAENLGKRVGLDLLKKRDKNMHAITSNHLLILVTVTKVNAFPI